MPCDGKLKPSGITPMTSEEWPFTRTMRPITFGSELKRSLHSLWLRTTTGAAPSIVSRGRMVRPSSGATPATSNAYPSAKAPS